MTLCRNCNKEASRIRTVFEIAGKQLAEPKDCCEHCKDGGLHNDPDWMRGRPVPLWESRPHLYKKKDDPDGGSMYEPTDENRADLEAQIMKGCEDDEVRLQAAIEHKRKNRRTAPLTPEETALMLQRAHKIAEPAVNAYKEQQKQFEEAEQAYWSSFRIQ
jgi:hypothetical protein